MYQYSRMYNPCTSRINKSSNQSRAVLLQRGRKGGSSLCAVNLMTMGMGCAKTDHLAKENCGCSWKSRAGFWAQPLQLVPLTLGLDHVSNSGHLFPLRNTSIPTPIPEISLPAVQKSVDK